MTRRLVPGLGQSHSGHMSQPNDFASVAAIGSYHAHIYFRGAQERETAAALREAIAARFVARLGRWHEAPIGPHALPMYQVAFAAAEFPRLVPWLMLNRQGLAILVHPNTRNPRWDHLEAALWMGAVMPIMHVERLPESRQDAETDHLASNTEPHLPA